MREGKGTEMGQTQAHLMTRFSGGATADRKPRGRVARTARKAEGRRSADEITLFKSVGVAIVDLAAADLVYRAALARA